MPRDNLNIQIKATGVLEFKKFVRRFLNELRKACGIGWIRWQWMKLRNFFSSQFEKKPKWSMSAEAYKAAYQKEFGFEKPTTEEIKWAEFDPKK